MPDTYIKNSRYEILESDNGDCYIKDLAINKYYFKKEYYLSRKIDFDTKEILKWNYKDTIFTGSIVISLIALFLMIFQYNILFDEYEYRFKTYIIAVSYLILNIALHEIGHTLTLRLYGRKGGRIRFKFNFIYPTFAVDTSDSYILPKHRRIFVYYAGIMVNILICFATYLFFSEYAYYLKSVIWLIIFNLLPIAGINTDGYHIFIFSLLNVRDYKYKKSMLFRVGKLLFIIGTSIMLIISILKSFGFFK